MRIKACILLNVDVLSRSPFRFPPLCIEQLLERFHWHQHLESYLGTKPFLAHTTLLLSKNDPPLLSEGELKNHRRLTLYVVRTGQARKEDGGRGRSCGGWSKSIPAAM